MAAVASNHMSEGMRGMDDQFSEQSASSRFTAVNGQVSPSSVSREKTANGHEDARNGAPVVSGDADLHDVITVQQPMPAVRQPTQPTQPIQQAQSTPQTQPAQPVQEQPAPAVNDQSVPYNGSGPSSTSRSPPSRKRSFPEAFGDSNGSHLSSHVHRTHAEAPEYTRGPPGPYTHAGSKLPPGHEIDQERSQPPLSSEYDPHAQPSQPYYGQPPSDDSEARLAEALQRENGSGPVNRETFVSPETDDPNRQQYPGEYGQSRSQLAAAKRKRIFSNRTKTGCMTCRKRKKKCDEQHPECEFHLEHERRQGPIRRDLEPFLVYEGCPID